MSLLSNDNVSLRFPIVCELIKVSSFCVASIEAGESLCSPVFSVPVESSDGLCEQQNLSFQLEVFPNGEGEDNSDYVAVFLTSRRQEDLEVKYAFSVEKTDEMSCWGRIGNSFKKFSPEQNSWGYGKAFSKSKLAEKANELLPDGKLTIVCDLEICYSDRQTKGCKPRVVYHREETNSLGDCMLQAYIAPEFADVHLVCDDRRLPAHKFILSARSDVFAAMFSHKRTTECQRNEVIITDTEPDILEAMLRFIYTDHCPLTRENAGGLLTAADKYNLPRLKGQCEEFLCHNIDANNVQNALLLSHLHEATQLQKFAVDFILNNVKKVTQSPGWNAICETHPKIMTELILKLTNKR